MATESKTLIIPELARKMSMDTDGKKKLAEILLDPRTIAMADNSPESREAIASVVRKLQAERQAKRNGRAPEQSKDPAWNIFSAFSCTNFVRLLTTQPRERQCRHKRSCRHHGVMAAAGDASSSSVTTNFTASRTGKLLLTGQQNGTSLNTGVDSYVCQELEIPSSSGVDDLPMLSDTKVTPRLEDINADYIEEHMSISLQQKESLGMSDMLGVSQDVLPQKDTNVKRPSIANYKFGVNGTELPPKMFLKKRFEVMDGIHLQNSNLPSPDMVFNLLPSAAQHHIRVIHDLDGNDLTNLKAINATLIPTKSYSAIIILEPTKITEIPLCVPAMKWHTYSKLISSSTQTDTISSSCSSSSDLYDDNSFQATEDKQTNADVIKATHDILKNASYSSMSKNEINRSRVASRIFESRISSSNSEVDGQEDCCSTSEEDNGARYLSKILMTSKGPNKNLISPEVIITYSGRNSCTEKCFESEEICHGTDESCDIYNNFPGEAIASDGIHCTNKWPRKRMKTSASYCMNKNTPLLDMSTGYIQLSDKEDVSDSGTGYYIKNDDETRKFNVDLIDINENEKNICGEENYERSEEEDQEESVEPNSSLNVSWENIPLTDMTERQDARGNQTLNTRRPPFPTKLKRTTLARRSSSMSSIGGRETQHDGIQLRQTGSAIRFIIGDQDALQRQADDTSSELSQNYSALIKNQCRYAEQDISSSEEEQRRQYKRNLEVMRMKMRTDKELTAMSSPKVATPPPPAGKWKRPSSQEKSKEKSKHKNCSIM